jgi:hypothetical protein
MVKLPLLEYIYLTWCLTQGFSSVFIDPEGVHRGTQELNEAAGKLFTQFPGYRFSVVGGVQALHGIGRLGWAYGPPEDPRRIRGEDIGVTKDGKILALYTFINPSKDE